MCKGKEKQFKCSVCDFCFFTENGRNMHEENACFHRKGEKVEIRKNFNCRWCGGGFWNKEMRREHKQKYCYIVKKIKEVTGEEEMNFEMLGKGGEGEDTEEDKFKDAVEQVEVSEDNGRKKIEELIKETEEELPKGCNYFWGFE